MQRCSCNQSKGVRGLYTRRPPTTVPLTDYPSHRRLSSHSIGTIKTRQRHRPPACEHARRVHDIQYSCIKRSGFAAIGMHHATQPAPNPLTRSPPPPHQKRFDRSGRVLHTSCIEKLPIWKHNVVSPMSGNHIIHKCMSDITDVV